MSASINAPMTITRQPFQRLMEALAQRGYRVVGPFVRDGAIVYNELASVTDLPMDRQRGVSGRQRKRIASGIGSAKKQNRRNAAR